MNKTKIFLLSAFLCVGTLLETSCNNDDDSVIYTNTEQSNPANSQNQQVENNIDNNQENADNNVLDSEQDNEGTKTLYMTLVLNTANISKTGISKDVDMSCIDFDCISFVMPKGDELCFVGGGRIHDDYVDCTYEMGLKITGKNEDVDSFERGDNTLIAIMGSSATMSGFVLGGGIIHDDYVDCTYENKPIKPIDGNITTIDFDDDFDDSFYDDGNITTIDLSSPLAQVVNLGTVNSGTSYSSVEEAKHANTLLMSPPIKYSSEPVYAELKEVEDVAQPAYIEILMSPLQHNIDVTIDGKIQNYQMSDDGKVCITVADGSSFSTNFTDIVVAKSGDIITINREGLVDLGLSDGTLWADKNVGADTYDGLGEYYNFDAAQTAVSGKLSVPKGGQSDNDFVKLKNGCIWTWTMGYNGGSLAGYIVYKQGRSNKDSEPHIFLPAAGMHRNGEDVNFDNPRGYYWSSTQFDVYYGYHLYFNEKDVCPEDWYYNYSEDYIIGQFPVRAVWHK